MKLVKTIRNLPPAVRIFLGLVLVFSVGQGLVALAKTQVTPWPKRLEHVRIESPWSELLAEDIEPDNAWYFFLRMTNKNDRSSSTEFREDVRRFNAFGLSTNTYAQLASWRADHPHFIQRWKKAGQTETAQAPTPKNYGWLDCRTAVIQSYQCAALIAEKAARDGAWSEFDTWLSTGLRASDHLSRGSGVSFAMEHQRSSELFLRVLRRVAHQHEPPIDRLKNWQDQLDAITADLEPPESVYQIELELHRQRLNHLYTNPQEAIDGSRRAATHGMVRVAENMGLLALWSLGGSTLPNTDEHCVAVYTHLIDAVSKPYDPQLNSPMALARHTFFNKVDDPIGRTWALPFLRPQNNGYRRHQANLAATRLTLALLRYRADHENRLPSKLEQLVPDYIEALPEDPFSRQREGFLYATK
ncbi:MAG: hypothetical protein AAF492_10890, partial [Verrucomicrobiota bacterium]